MAVDPEGLYFTFNQFHFDTYVYEGAIITAVDKEDVYAFQGTTPVEFGCSTNPGDGSLAFAVRPAQMRSYRGEMYFLNNKFQGGTIFTFFSLRDPFTSPVFNKSSITTSAYSLPTQMRQPNGTYVDVGDCRVADLVYDAQSLFAVFCSYRSLAGIDLSQIGFWEFGVSPGTYRGGVGFSMSNSFVSYPSLDMDEYGRAGFGYTYCSHLTPAFLSTGFKVWDPNLGTTLENGTLAAGLANYTLGGSGTSGSPYSWGNYTGCAIDPVDDRTFWVFGAYASNDPTPSWTTRVGAVSGFPQSDLNIAPAVSVTGGVSGGPIAKEILPVTLSNRGETDLHWRMDNHPWWATPSAMTGQIPPGGSQIISLFIHEDARWLPVGFYEELVQFINCTGTVSATCTVQLTIVEPIACPCAAISAVPEIGDAAAVYGSDEYSLFVTAMEDIDVCAIGLMLVDPEPKSIGCYVYEANGTTRGPMVYSNSQIAVQDVEGTYLVPMDVSLEACQDYEIVFVHPDEIAHVSYDETDFSYPFDVNGVVRVRQSATNGSVGDTKHPAIVIFGHSSCDQVAGQTTDLYRNVTEHTESSTNSSQGLFITARENLYLCSVGFEADLVRDRWLVARIWEASGNVRGSLVAEGFLPAQTGGLAQHEIPIHALVEAGRDYNVSVVLEEKGYWPAIAESEVTLPYTVGGDIQVRKAEFNGAASTDLPHLWLNWDEIAVRGAPFDLAKSADGIPAPNSGSGPIDHGAFVQPAATQEIYSLGVRANIPEGTIVIARIYRLTIQGLRGPLQTEGWITSSGAGMRWYDVPLAFRWQAGNRYDLSIVCSNSNEYRYWLDTAGMPYSPYGVIQVQDAEIGGGAAGTALIHMRINACDEVMTAVDDNPPRFSPLSLEPPVPNPANGLVRFRYAVDAPRAIDLEIYDVAGRRVAPVFIGRYVNAGPGAVEFDASGLVSGVYFLRLTAGDKAVSRKIVVTR